ncbi:GH25 family lysozyme [Aquimarina gracilis]|uniref:GH25 family lysozyme n=1 Tax=Aquimarina gracilis TaxID=874422 RepID=A0ABU5ZTS9_9FLAO|nr:GH25 family lysozyme [Aquimarina gracilis]MEB3345465.1 GH25 family lysozyme [Aquimarina gracilis]
MKKMLPFVLFILFLTISCKKDTNAKTDNKNQDSQKSLCNDEKRRIETEPTILGIDISHFQHDIKWDEIKADGVNFVYMKATEGTHFKDPKFKENHAATKKECLYRGAYHFYETGKDPKKQALNFIEAVGELIAGDLPPVLDLEELGVKTPVTKEMYEVNTLIWLKTVEEKLGVRPIIYTNSSFGNQYLKHPEFAKYQLWVAEYTKAQSPKVPETWKNRGWIIWQRTDRKAVEGVGKVDYDLFNGKAEDFLKMIKK